MVLTQITLWNHFLTFRHCKIFKIYLLLIFGILFQQKDNISVSVCWKIFDVYLQSIIWIKDTIMWCCCDVQSSCRGQRWAGVCHSGPGGLDASLEKWYKGYLCWVFTGKKILSLIIRNSRKGLFPCILFRKLRKKDTQ